MDILNPSGAIAQQIAFSIRRLMSQQDVDPYSPTRGCFDRRYWSWKLVDYPDATYQRNVQPLSELWADPQSPFHQDPELLAAVLAGLEYSAMIQHSDGSFDQAFPEEHSFAATGFLLHSLLEARKVVSQHMDLGLRRRVDACLSRASDFLCCHSEKHGVITNHLAGVALALFLSGEYFGQPQFTRRAEEALEGILASQSKEGWFPEYDGADPGYQTLCLYYLAQIWKKWPSGVLEQSLERSLHFLAYFVHPDGTFAGEYGSRRTQVFYPGGTALLADRFPLAYAMGHQIIEAVSRGRSVGLADMDMGNLSPLLSNYVLDRQALLKVERPKVVELPWQMRKVQEYFPEAGLLVHGNEDYYTVLSLANGGVIKVFDKKKRALLWDDSGYVGRVIGGGLITTQKTLLNRRCQVNGNEVELECYFYKMPCAQPNSLSFVLLRLLSLSLLRSVRLGNIFKKALVKMLISPDGRQPVKLLRRVRFEKLRVVVEDELTKSSRLKLDWLKMGRRFLGIHMASAGYFDGGCHTHRLAPPQIDVHTFNRENRLKQEVVIHGRDA